LSASAKPVRLILLAEAPEWADRLRECLGGLGNPYPLFTAPSWAAASCLLGDQRPSILLSTPACLPAPGQCSLPSLLLLEQEPSEPPSGVSDWLVRDSLNAEVLRRCLRYACDQHQLKQTLERLTEEDALTGIANRQGFHSLLAARLAEYHGAGLTLGYLDLDNFRRANDALGHQAGDRLIQQVVQRLKAQLTAEDQLARLGGDEFALLLDTRRDAGRALRLAERLTAALAEPYWVDGESLLIGCSLGLARAEPGEGADPLMWHAHLAMQQAKSTDGCVFHLYDERINRSARSQAVLEGELRHALRRDELELHYQPRLCLRSNRVVGLEALVRWRHPERGLLAPSEFVPLAEETGLIVPLGYWVIARALRDMQWLRKRGIAPLHMAINLSFRQFQDSQLRDTLSRLIAEHRIDAAWLEFELTETAIMRRSDQVRATMLELEQLGVRFSLDDFGTGFSSFVHLNSLPISLLKIDKSFVAGMFERGENQKLVRAMIDLAHNLDLQVVAEGVEQPDQLERLRAFGCDQVQGYLISCPLPLVALTGYLSAASQTAVL
jgi:diguanylate cyclase (GGDEF)-like protein